ASNSHTLNRFCVSAASIPPRLPMRERCCKPPLKVALQKKLNSRSAIESVSIIDDERARHVDPIRLPGDGHAVRSVSIWAGPVPPRCSSQCALGEGAKHRKATLSLRFRERSLSSQSAGQSSICSNQC